MTQDEIREMAKEVGMLKVHIAYDAWVPDYVEAFAKLVAAKEREACAKVCEARAEEEVGMAYEGIALDCAKEIRARGQA